MFSFNFAKFLRAPFFTEHLRWLQLLGLKKTSSIKLKYVKPQNIYLIPDVSNVTSIILSLIFSLFTIISNRFHIFSNSNYFYAGATKKFIYLL